MDIVTAEFGAVSILNAKQFSFVFLLDIVLALLLSLFIVFYFNRFVGWVLSLALKFLFWHRHKVHVKVQSVQLSLLGGRLFFKNLSYVGTNEAVTVLQGHLTWRYWLWHTRRSSLEACTEGDPALAAPNLPIRFSLHLNGLEWFVYNRSPAYDELLKAAKKAQNAESSPDEGPATATTTNVSTEPPSQDEYTEKAAEGGGVASNASTEPDTHQDSGSDRGADGAAKEDETAGPAEHNDDTSATLLSEPQELSYTEKLYVRMFPIEVTCEKGAVVIGDKDVPSLLIMHFVSGKSVYDVRRPRSAFDKFTSAMDFVLEQPRVQLRPHVDYNADQPGSRLFRVSSRRRQNGLVRAIRAIITAGMALGRWFGSLRHWRQWKLSPRSSLDSTADDPDAAATGQRGHGWHGLSRYDIFGTAFDEEEDVIGFDSEFLEEYGKFSTIIDTEAAEIEYFWDDPGVVPHRQQPFPGTATKDGPDVGNGGLPPDWGMRIAFKDTTINWGPWADRQRIPLQSLLMPRSCVDAIPDPRLEPGDRRAYTKFDCDIEFEGDVFVRIPLREPSKNQAFVAHHKDDLSATRPFGWVELKAKSSSHLSLFWQMMPTHAGWLSEFNVDFVNPELRTSVNHGLLFCADYHKVRILMQAPLKWNGLQTWSISHDSDAAQLFFLREHVTLISDLMQDFSASPSPPYDLFTPFSYDVDWRINGYKLHLNINDLNIINNPSDFEENTFVTFQGASLHVHTFLPLEDIAMVKNTMKFEISVRLCSPPGPS